MYFAGVASFAQDRTKEVKKAPAPVTSAASGSEMFISYCAACHGKYGKGNGPAATALKEPAGQPDATVDEEQREISCGPCIQCSEEWLNGGARFFGYADLGAGVFQG
jgi:mono/diheme cytochrome c family protein